MQEEFPKPIQRDDLKTVKTLNHYWNDMGYVIFRRDGYRGQNLVFNKLELYGP